VFHCTPHPGLGSVAVRQVQVDLATCRTSKAPPVPASGATVRVTKNSQSIVFDGKVVLAIHENHKGFPAGSPGPIELEGVSPDGKWILYAIDPMGSASLAADGLTLQAIRVTGGRSYTVESGLMYASYRSWCNSSTLVLTAGGDRLAAHDKRLIVTGPPAWKPHPLVNAPQRAFGTVVCAPDGKSVVVQEEPMGGTNDSSVASHWQLWRITLAGEATRRLTHPPTSYSDDSPQFSPDQRTIYFVRSKNDRGALYALQDGTLVGPLLDLGLNRNAYYGHRDWPYTVVG
jgi:WD40-like Beta Propeller Repeat